MSDLRFVLVVVLVLVLVLWPFSPRRIEDEDDNEDEDDSKVSQTRWQWGFAPGWYESGLWPEDTGEHLCSRKRAAEDVGQNKAGA